MFKIDKTVDNGKAVFAIEGYLDTLTTPELEEALKDSLDGIQELVFDFDKLEYVSSRGLRALLTANKIMAGRQGTMLIRNVSEEIMDTFDVTGLTDKLSIK